MRQATGLRLRYELDAHLALYFALPKNPSAELLERELCAQPGGNRTAIGA